MTQMNLMKPTITKERLERLETDVNNALASYQQAGQALIEIRDSYGYKLKGYKTFEDYCITEFGASDRHARRLIEGAQTAEKVEKVMGAAPRNEGVARELRQVADDPIVLGKVQKELERKKLPLARATAEAVHDAIAKVTGKAKAAANGNGHAKPAAAAPAPAPRLPTLSDICPGCVMTPTTYIRQDDGWHCGACGAPVLLGVIAAAPQACPQCNAAVADAATGFCGECGAPL